MVYFKSGYVQDLEDMIERLKKEIEELRKQLDNIEKIRIETRKGNTYLYLSAVEESDE